MGALSGTASTEIDASIEVVWAIVQDVESAPAWQRGFESVTALERDADGRPTSCDTVTDMKVKRLRSRVAFTYEPPGRLAWAQSRGDLSSMSGSWALEDLGDGRTRATYALRADPGVLLSRFIKGALEEKLRGLMIDGRPAELKARVERLAGSAATLSAP
jgi:carbon monoxide dehydrogenase subunit G